MVHKNRSVIRETFLTAPQAKDTLPYNSHGIPEPGQTTRKSDPTVGDTSQIIQKGEWVVRLEGWVTKKCCHAVQ